MASNLLSERRSSYLTGIVCSPGQWDIAIKYANACFNYLRVLSITEDTDWRELYTWIWNHHWRPMGKLIVTTQVAVKFLDAIRNHLAPTVIGLELDEPLAFDFDTMLSAHDLGWGVDKEYWRSAYENRLWRHKPVLYFTEPSHLADELRQNFDVIFETGKRDYHLGDVAVVPSKRTVPKDIYEAAASGIATVTVRDNKGWLDDIPSFNSFLDDGLSAVVAEIQSSDFKQLGYMAREFVPGLEQFHTKVRELLLTS